MIPSKPIDFGVFLGIVTAVSSACGILLRNYMFGYFLDYDFIIAPIITFMLFTIIGTKFKQLENKELKNDTK